MKPIKLDKFEEGTKVLVLPVFSKIWLEGTVISVKDVTDKFVDLHNGEELFEFQIRRIEVL